MPLVGEVPAPPPAVRRSAVKTPAPKPPAKEDKAPSSNAERVNTLMEFASIGQGIALMFGQYADAETIEMHGRPFLSSVAKLGDVHPSFGESIDNARGMSPYVALFASAAPLLLQFMANHGRIDASKVRVGGIQNPRVLADRQAAKVMQMQADSVREQREAAEAAAAAQQKLAEEIAAFNSVAESMNAGV